MFRIPNFTLFLFSFFFTMLLPALILFSHFPPLSQFCFFHVTIFLFFFFFTRILLPLFNYFHTILVHSCFLYFTTFFPLFPCVPGEAKCNCASLNQCHK